MKKINQSYAYCDKQIEWVKEHLSAPVVLSDLDQDDIVCKFYEEFGIKRSFRALCQFSRRNGFRGSEFIEKPVVGVTTKIGGRKGSSRLICYAINPTRYMPIPRYVYQKHHNVKLNRNDVIIHLDGNVYNNNIDNLKLISRTDLLKMNKLPEHVPLETRYLLATLDSKVEDISGRGSWSDEEKEWLLKIPYREKFPRNFWSKKTNEFNKLFNKNRIHSNLSSMYTLLRRQQE